jgi:hypothetical protein
VLNRPYKNLVGGPDLVELNLARTQIDGVIDTLVKAGHLSADQDVCKQIFRVIGELEWLKALVGDIRP